MKTCTILKAKIGILFFQRQGVHSVKANKTIRHGSVKVEFALLPSTPDRETLKS